MEVYIATNYYSCNHETVIRRRKNKTCAILFGSKVGHFDKREFRIFHGPENTILKLYSEYCSQFSDSGEYLQ